MSAGSIAPPKVGMKSTEYIHTQNNKIIFKIKSLWAPSYHYNCGQMVKTVGTYRRSPSSFHAITQPNHNIFFCIPVTQIYTPLIPNISQNSNYSLVHKKLPKQLWYHKRKENHTIYLSSPVLSKNLPLTYQQPQGERLVIKSNPRNKSRGAPGKLATHESAAPIHGETLRPH